jgi:hypothetical protein
MALNLWDTSKMKDGDYVQIFGLDSEEERERAQQALLAHGCRTVRFVQLDDGRLQAHGYL